MEKIILAIILTLVVGVVFYQVHQSAPSPGRTANPLKASQNAPTIPTRSVAESNRKHLIAIQTNLGSIRFETYDADAPKTVENFIKLVNQGFYNGLTFHRVIPGFMIQGGDPNCTPARSKGPCGTGGPGYQFEDELNSTTESYREGYQRGVVAMANAGPHTNGSQFFIMHADYSLPHNYTIFGKVVVGQEVVDKIATTPRDAKDRPLTSAVIQEARVEKLP